MKPIYQISFICLGLFAVSAFMVIVYFYPEPLGMTRPHVIVREGDYSEEGKKELDFFREYVSTTCPYSPKPKSATSYDPVNCIWVNNECTFESHPKYKKLFDSNGEIYVGLVDEFGSLIICENIVIRMPESEPFFEDVSSIPPEPELLCMGGRGFIVNEKCERIGNYDPITGLPIVENKEQCDLLEGDWDEEQKICDSKYGGK